MEVSNLGVPPLLSSLPKLNLVHFSLKIWHLVATNFKDFPENQLTKFRAEFPNYIHNLEAREMQNIELRLPVKQLRTIWIFYRFTARNFLYCLKMS